ncbi:unnamed protein product, partial [Callosobruchus maculatus]
NYPISDRSQITFRTSGSVIELIGLTQS